MNTVKDYKLNKEISERLMKESKEPLPLQFSDVIICI